MGKVKYFQPLGVAEAFRQYCVDRGLNPVTPDGLQRFVDEQYPQGGEGRPNEIYLQRLLYNSSDTSDTPEGRASTNKLRFTKVGPNTYSPRSIIG